jgi:hypothetical protein
MTIGGGVATPGAGAVDFHQLVNAAADEFQGQYGVIVLPGCRELLINRALPYSQHVQQEISTGNVTIEFLKRSLFTVLENAHQIGTPTRLDIDEDLIEQSMERYCPYLFWC